MNNPAQGGADLKKNTAFGFFWECFKPGKGKRELGMKKHKTVNKILNCS